MTKKTQIIQASRELFTKYGYKKVSMDEIAKKSGVTKRTIYTYFSDKESMFKYFIEEELTTMRNKIDEDISSSLPFVEKVSKILYESLLFRKNSDLIKTINNEIGTSNTYECISVLKYYDMQIIDDIEKRIEKEVENNNIKKCDSHLTAFIIYKIYASVLFEYDKAIDEEKIAKEITNILKNGLFQ